MICEGCEAQTQAGSAQVFRCPEAREGDDIDHLLVPAPCDALDSAPPDISARSPFLIDRKRLFAYRCARLWGWSDGRFVDLVSELEEAIASLCGTGFFVTPLVEAETLGHGGQRWFVKDETNAVGRSHKARHLMGALLFLEVRRRSGRAPRDAPPLAIASCGNAAIAAAILARAAGRSLDAFVPEEVDASIRRGLEDLGVRIHLCPRAEGFQGDPCLAAFRDAAQSGALPFCCQGPECGLCLDGGRTLAWELARQLADVGAGSRITMAVQVGGGALASSLRRGFASENLPLPQLLAIQPRGCHPLGTAWERLREELRVKPGLGWRRLLEEARGQRSRFMRPWPTPPSSAAEGILDDETYDWMSILHWLCESEGRVVIPSEEELIAAPTLLEEATQIRASTTGAAGLAGLLHCDAEAGWGQGDSLVAIATGGKR